MSERRDLNHSDELDSPAHDPDKGSTWNTFDRTAEIDELLSEQEWEDFMEEPTHGELGIISDTDIPGAPG
jgi:hypothetical protein